MSKLRTGRWYTFAQLREMAEDPELANIKLKGFVLQHDVNTGLIRFVHHSAATLGREKARTYDDGGFEPLDPIKKRTPQERVDSLMLRFIDDCKKAGTVPGLDDDRMKLIVGEAWKAGETEITGEVVRAVAQHFLADAEAKA